MYVQPITKIKWTMSLWPLTHSTSRYIALKRPKQTEMHVGSCFPLWFLCILTLLSLVLNSIFFLGTIGGHGAHVPLSPSNWTFGTLGKTAACQIYNTNILNNIASKTNHHIKDSWEN